MGSAVDGRDHRDSGRWIVRLAEALVAHAALRQAGGGEVVQAVVALHSPDEGQYVPRTFAECDGCDAGLYAESGIDWPCRTILVINWHLHVDAVGYLPC
jgi:hypothetical protein